MRLLAQQTVLTPFCELHNFLSNELKRDLCKGERWPRENPCLWSSFSSSCSMAQELFIEPWPADCKISTLVYPLFFFYNFLYSVSYWNPPLLSQFKFCLAAFPKLRKETASFVTYVCPYAWDISAPTGRIFIRYDNWIFSYVMIIEYFHTIW